MNRTGVSNRQSWSGTDPAGGAVFSTGSITFCGSLPHNGYDNSISKILANVLDRFLDGNRDFAWPG